MSWTATTYLAGLPLATAYFAYVAQSYQPFERSSVAFYALSVVLWPLALAGLLLYGALVAVAEPACAAYERRQRARANILPSEQEYTAAYRQLARQIEAGRKTGTSRG